MSPERRIKAKIRGLRQYWIREREKIRQKENVAPSTVSVETIHSFAIL